MSNLPIAAARFSSQSLKIQRVAAILQTRLAPPPSCRDLAREMAIGHNSLDTLFREIYGGTIHQYSKRCQMKQAEILIRSGKYSMTEVIH